MNHILLIVAWWAYKLATFLYKTSTKRGWHLNTMYQIVDIFVNKRDSTQFIIASHIKPTTAPCVQTCTCNTSSFVLQLYALSWPFKTTKVAQAVRVDNTQKDSPFGRMGALLKWARVIPRALLQPSLRWISGVKLQFIAFVPCYIGAHNKFRTCRPLVALNTTALTNWARVRGHSICKKKSKFIKPNYNICIVR